MLLAIISKVIAPPSSSDAKCFTLRVPVFHENNPLIASDHGTWLGTGMKRRWRKRSPMVILEDEGKEIDKRDSTAPRPHASEVGANGVAAPVAFAPRG